MEHLPILGGTPEEKEEAREELIAHAEKMKASVWSTREKTPEQVMWIEMVNRYIGEEMKDLGLESTPIASEQVRFLDSIEWYEVTQRPPLDRAEGEHNTNDRTISINTEEIEVNCQNRAVDVRLKEFAVLLHEALHERGFIRHDIRKQGVIDVYRGGYAIAGEDENGVEREKFQGFNEGVIELLTMRLLDLHKEEIKEKFGVDLHTEENKDDRNCVWNYINRRNAAVLIANVYEEDFDVLWRNYFTGNMMHLRKIEKKYGKKALRVLSLFDDGREEGGLDKVNKIQDFFEGKTSPAQRDEIKNDLLENKQK